MPSDEIPDDAPAPRETKPLRADARRNRARVLEAAEAVFTAKGTGASTEEIARRAGVGIGTVFRHFPTKEALLEAVFVARIARFAEQAGALAATHDPQTALFAVLTLSAELGATKRAIADALTAAGVDVDPLTSLAGKTLVQTLDELLAKAQQVDAVRDDVRVGDLIALLVGISRAVEHAGGDPEARQRLLAVLLDGLRSSRSQHAPS
jgi:AcrR family transcriptional regulator